MSSWTIAFPFQRQRKPEAFRFRATFKNSLTTLPIGGAKGGANFNPKGKSDREMMPFCHSLMIELHWHTGEDTDVPAGDIGVGAREIGYLVGMYRRLSNRVTGVMTGKGLAFGGSLVRKEATGSGAVCFLREMLAIRGEGLQGKTALVSGSGNVALFAIEKLSQFGTKVVIASGSDGFVHEPEGIRAEKNEISGEEAQALLANGVTAVAEGANMPTEIEGVRRFLDAKILFAPGRRRTREEWRYRVSSRAKTRCTSLGRGRKSRTGSSPS